MNQELSMKVQLGEKIKMLPKAQYESLDDLRNAALKSYPKRLQGKDIALKYADEEGDWLYLSEDEDLNALSEFATQLDNKKVKIVVEVKKPTQIQQEVEKVDQAMDDLTLEESKEVKFEDLKDFKFADITEKLEELFNSEEKFGKMKIWRVIKEAAEGTKAEHHFKRFGKGCRGMGGKHRRDKMFRKFFSSSASKERDHSSSGEDAGFPGFGGPMGPMGPFGAPHHFGPHHGFGGHFGPHHGHGPWHNKRAKKFFKKWMMTFKSDSSDESSDEKRERKRACREMKRQQKNGAPVRKLEFKLQNETIVGKAGEKVNFTVGIKDIAPHPIWLTGAKKIEGDAVGFEYQPMEEAKVFRDQEHEVELTATLPEEAGEYSLTIGFLNKKENFIKGNLVLNFRAE